MTSSPRTLKQSLKSDTISSGPGTNAEQQYRKSEALVSIWSIFRRNDTTDENRWSTAIWNLFFFIIGAFPTATKCILTFSVSIVASWFIFCWKEYSNVNACRRHRVFSCDEFLKNENEGNELFSTQHHLKTVWANLFFHVSSGSHLVYWFSTKLVSDITMSTAPSG